MHEAVMTPPSTWLSAWGSFYVILGSSAGALTGLTFVVISLVAQTDQREADRGIPAFTSPTIVHFGVVLFVSALLSVPWPALVPLAVPLGLCGLLGMLYSAIVMRRQRGLEAYTPELDDWIWYAACPFLAFAALLAAAILLPNRPAPALFVIAGAMVLLLFIGIRNAWDVVTYITIGRFTPSCATEPEQRNTVKERQDQIEAQAD